MKKIIYILASVLIFSGFGHAQIQLVDRIVAEVDNEIITYKQLSEELLPIVARIKSVGYPAPRQKELIDEVRGQMLKNLIDEKIAEISAARSNIKIDDEDVENFLQRIRSEQNASKKDFIKALKNEGYSIEEYKERLKKQILKKRLIDFEVRSKIVITKEDIKKYYNENPAEYSDKVELNLWHITFPKAYYKAENEEKIIETADKIKEETIKKGFETISKNIKEYSKGYEVVSGNLGFYKNQDLSKEVIEAVKGLNEKDISKVIATSRGVQFFYIAKRKVTPSETLEEVTPKIRRVLYNQEVEKRFAHWIEKLKENMHIRIIE